jgi:hypothetical protein
VGDVPRDIGIVERLKRPGSRLPGFRPFRSFGFDDDLFLDSELVRGVSVALAMKALTVMDFRRN